MRKGLPSTAAGSKILSDTVVDIRRGIGVTSTGAAIIIGYNIDNLTSRPELLTETKAKKDSEEECKHTCACHQQPEDPRGLQCRPVIRSGF